MKHDIYLDDEQEENLKDYINHIRNNVHQEMDERKALSVIIGLGFEELGYL